MEDICPICFRNLEKEPHADWCPNKLEILKLEDIFPGINK
jgi:hypothetical protein